MSDSVLRFLSAYPAEQFGSVPADNDAQYNRCECRDDPLHRVQIRREPAGGGYSEERGEDQSCDESVQQQYPETVLACDLDQLG